MRSGMIAVVGRPRSSRLRLLPLKLGTADGGPGNGWVGEMPHA
jgi:hypothetical protein